MKYITVTFSEDETDVLRQYIDFMEEFDDDPTFRLPALEARKKLNSAIPIDGEGRVKSL